MSQNFKETITKQHWKEVSTKAAKVTCNLKENCTKCSIDGTINNNYSINNI